MLVNVSCNDFSVMTTSSFRFRITLDEFHKKRHGYLTFSSFTPYVWRKAVMPKSETNTCFQYADILKVISYGASNVPAKDASSFTNSILHKIFNKVQRVTRILRVINGMMFVV